MYIRIFASLLFLLGLAPASSIAQDTSNKIELFREDTKKVKDALETQKQKILSNDKTGREDLDVQAPTIRFDSETKTVHADGGMLISGKGLQAQADKGSVNTETKQAHLEGNVVFSGYNASIEGTEADVNLDDETGEFQDGSFVYESGGYKVEGRKMFKLSETRYKLFDSKFTTCNCLDGLCPWSIDSEESKISQEGYVQTYNTTMWFHGVPIFYTPYMAFPAKLERTSGLLAPSFGYSSEDGFKYRQKIFWAVNESTDLFITPFTETLSRNGAEIHFKRSFTKDNKAEGKLLYSNESPRGTDLKGTRTEDLADPTIDTNRVGIFYNQFWRSDEVLPLRFIADVHHVGDGTMVKELPDNDIVDPTARVATSSAILRAGFGEYLSGELLGEYNQAVFGAPSSEGVVGTQDLIFQKAPEASLSFLKSFRPIENPYGLRLVTKANLTETIFARETGYDGARTSFNPSASIPFHLSNYVSGSVGAGAYLNSYALNNDIDPTTNEIIEDGQSSKVPYLTGSLSTAFERPYIMDDNSWLTYMSGLGKRDQDQKLVRVKHVIEPLLKYTLVPDITQDTLPKFDGLDGISERSLLTYGVKTSLLGRFSPRKDVATGVPEFTPEIRDFPTFDGMKPLPEYGAPQELQPISGDTTLRSGEIRSLIDLAVTQGYDFRKQYRRDQQKDAGIDSIIYPLTDIKTSLGFTPTSYFGLKVDSYFNQDESRFTGWGVKTEFKDDRGDGLTLGYTFVGPPVGFEDGNPQIDQTAGGLEAVLTERLKVGFYTQYSDVPGDKGPITTRMAFRLLSACNCWHMDVGYADKTNPDKQLMYLTFTFTGLGDISQELFSWGQGGQ